MLNVATLTNESPFYAVNLGNFQPAGFSEGRNPSVDNNAAIKTLGGYQKLIPAATPNVVYGFGQTNGNFTGQFFTAAANKNAVYSSHLLLGSGTWSGTGPPPGIDVGAPNFSIVVFNNNTGNSVSNASFCSLDCMLLDIADAYLEGINSTNTALVQHTFNAYLLGIGPATWTNFGLDAFQPDPGAVGNAPAIPATFDPATKKFSWNPFGSPAGYYTWHVTASIPSGAYDQGYVVVHVTVPEPATLCLCCMAILARFTSARSRLPGLHFRAKG